MRQADGQHALRNETTECLLRWALQHLDARPTKFCHHPPSIGHDHGFSRCDLAQKGAKAILQFPNGNGFHGCNVAPRSYASKLGRRARTRRGSFPSEMAQVRDATAGPPMAADLHEEPPWRSHAPDRRRRSSGA
jgi:hypothetical protein